MQTQPVSDLRMWLFATIPACAILCAILPSQALGILLTLFSLAALECGRLGDSRCSHVIARYSTCSAVAVIAFMILHLLMQEVTPADEFVSEDDLALAHLSSLYLRLQATLAATSALLFAGCIAGRLRLSPQLALCAILAMAVYPLFVSWTWGGGWLSRLGFYDFAGGTVVYAIAAWSGLGVAFALRMSSSSAQVLRANRRTWLFAIGGLLLWFSVAGIGLTGPQSDEAAYIGVTTNIGAAGGLLSATVLSWLVFRVWRLQFVFGGCLAGVAAICAGAGSLSPVDSVCAGVGAGVLFVGCVWGLGKLSIPDDLGIVSAFGAGGAWGTLCVGLLGINQALLPQVVGTVIAFVWAFGVFAVAGWLAIKVSRGTDNAV